MAPAPRLTNACRKRQRSMAAASWRSSAAGIWFSERLFGLSNNPLTEQSPLTKSVEM